MKKILVFMVVVSSVMCACVKSATGTGASSTSCTDVDTTVEDPTIQAFCNADSVHFTRDSSGVYYHITDTGTGASATSANVIIFNYTATLINGEFIANGQSQQIMTSLIEGFQLMEKHFKEGTVIELVIPSSLAYGCTGAGSIVAPNSVVSYVINISAVE
jgi:FKBP-type peptidyl-prolyl cis-trans isomerase FkpA